MADALALNPVDIPVALALIVAPNDTYQQLSSALGVSTSTAHASVARLQQAGLLRSGKREVVPSALLEFLEHGVRYAFPAVTAPPTWGVPTAHSGPALASLIVADEPVVWPSDQGTAMGPAITPLFNAAPELPARSPEVYSLLTLVDALRVGRLRERNEAMRLLRRRLYPNAAAA